MCRLQGIEASRILDPKIQFRLGSIDPFPNLTNDYDLFGMHIRVVMDLEFHSEAGEFQLFFASNEPPQRISLYLGRQLEADLSKI